MKKLSYLPARTAVQFTSLIYLSQVLLEVLLAVSGGQRKPEYSWIVPAAAAAFWLAVLYSIAVAFWNAYVDYQEKS